MKDKKSSREGIWSIPGGTHIWYFVIFGILFAFGVWVSATKALSETCGWRNQAVQFWSDAGPLAIASAAAALVVIEIWEIGHSAGVEITKGGKKLMVIAAYLKEKFGWGRKDDSSSASDVGQTSYSDADRSPIAGQASDVRRSPIAGQTSDVGRSPIAGQTSDVGRASGSRDTPIAGHTTRDGQTLGADESP